MDARADAVGVQGVEDRVAMVDLDDVEVPHVGVARCRTAGVVDGVDVGEQLVVDRERPPRRWSFHFSRRASLARSTIACMVSSREVQPKRTWWYRSSPEPWWLIERTSSAMDASSVTTAPASP